jgi:ABC-type lipoprotein export system ATPase subunit
MSLLVAEQLGKTYAAGESQVAALKDVSLTVSAGEFVAIVGPSGCGKSTLLHLCGAMDRPSSGRLTLDGERLDTMSEEALTRLRRGRIGFVFQFFNLLPTLTLGENIALPLLLAGTSSRDAMSRGAAFAERVGVSHRLDHLPAQLSGGELQRAAIARALVHSPILLVADEPTGNLDSANGARVLKLLQTLNRESGVTLLLATHAREIAAAAGRIIALRDGQIERIRELENSKTRDRRQGRIAAVATKRETRERRG